MQEHIVRILHKPLQILPGKDPAGVFRPVLPHPPFNLCQLIGILQCKPCYPGAHQGFHAPAAAQALADIMAQGPDIRAFGAMNLHPHPWEGNLQYLDGKNSDFPWLPLHLYPSPCQIAKFLPIDL